MKIGNIKTYHKFAILKISITFVPNNKPMTDIFFHDNGNFTNFGIEHGIAFWGCIIFIFYILYLGKNSWDAQTGRLFITLICGFGAFMQLFKVFYRLEVGILNLATDLPLHLCNIMTIIMPFIMWYKLRFMWAITFFWIISGHMTYSTLLFFTLAYLFSPYFLLLFLFSPFIAWSRIELEKHNLAQVIAGTLVTALICVLTYWA